MSEPLKLTLNGRERMVDGVTSPAMLDAVLGALELRVDRVAAELNGELASRAVWAETVVKSGDRLEIVHFVGGGSVSIRALFPFQPTFSCGEDGLPAVVVLPKLA